MSETSPEDALLTYSKQKGLDLELATAAAMKDAGFWVGQSLGVTPWRPPSIITVDYPANPPGAREVDVIAVRDFGKWSFAFAIECKPFRESAALGVMAVDQDRLPPSRTAVVVDQRFQGAFPGEQLDIGTDVRGFKLVSAPRSKSHAQALEKAEQKAAKEQGREPRDPAYHALLQVLDYADAVPSLAMFRERHCVPAPLLVVDAPLYEVRLNGETLQARHVRSATVRVAAHGVKTHRAVLVVTRAALPEFAQRSAGMVDRWLEAAQTVVKS